MRSVGESVLQMPCFLNLLQLLGTPLPAQMKLDTKLSGLHSKNSLKLVDFLSHVEIRPFIGPSTKGAKTRIGSPC